MAEIITKESAQVTRFLGAIERMMEGLSRLSLVHSKRQLGGEKFITDAELLKRLKVSDRTTQNWRSNGKIDYIQFEEGGKVLYRESDVQRFIESHFQKAWRTQ